MTLLVVFISIYFSHTSITNFSTTIFTSVWWWAQWGLQCGGASCAHAHCAHWIYLFIYLCNLFNLFIHQSTSTI